jgi:hypothetical protein
MVPDRRTRSLWVEDAHSDREFYKLWSRTAFPGAWQQTTKFRSYLLEFSPIKLRICRFGRQIFRRTHANQDVKSINTLNKKTSTELALQSGVASSSTGAGTRLMEAVG